MKKIIITAMAAIFMMSLVSCKSINIERETCDKACETAKNKCIDKLAKDKKGNVDEKKKALCNAAAKKCVDECAKKYGSK